MSVFSLFLCFSDMILSNALIFPVSQLQTQQVRTSQISSHIGYLIQTYYIILLNFQSRLMTNLDLMAGFNTL